MIVRLLLASLLLAFTGLSVAAPPATAANGLADFDFEIGTWKVHHRYLKTQPDGKQQWIEFEGTSVMRKIMDGLANLEENVFNTATGVRRGVALRSFDREKGTWAIWWLDERFPHGAMDPPVIGKFENGIGSFYSESVVNGKSVRTRYQWSHITATSAQWDQASSTDGGETWLPNWIMTFTRQ